MRFKCLAKREVAAKKEGAQAKKKLKSPGQPAQTHHIKIDDLEKAYSTNFLTKFNSKRALLTL
jgi:hypothetical protein